MKFSYVIKFSTKVTKSQILFGQLQLVLVAKMLAWVSSSVRMLLQ